MAFALITIARPRRHSKSIVFGSVSFGTRLASGFVRLPGGTEKCKTAASSLERWSGVSASRRAPGKEQRRHRASARNSVIDPTASGEGYKLIYTFPGGAGGADPLAPPTFVDGVAFGATYSGGDVSGCNCGTVFANGKVIYNFKGASSGDGAYPTGAFLLVGKELYGVTFQGGRSKGVCTSGSVHGCGTIFAIDAKGNERVIYRFKGGSDGEAPVSALISQNGVLYGVTAKGGTNGACSDGLPGCGVVFSVDSSGHEKVIYRFKGGTDGALPSAGLLVVKGQLYGTTATGGGDCPASTSGCGTVFRMTPSGSEKLFTRLKAGKMVSTQTPSSSWLMIPCTARQGSAGVHEHVAPAVGKALFSK